MCPEPDFGLCYHSLIAYYRPSPETTKSQLADILARYFSRQAGEETRRMKTEKGGAAT